jgi:glucarate dehydratase
VRAAIGPDRELRLDANMGWSLESARRALALLEPFQIANVEEPVRYFAEMAELRRSSSIPFSAHTPDVALAAELGVPDTVVAGLGFHGGIAGTRRFIATCEEAGIGFWFYSGDLGIATAAYLHLAAATPYLDRPSQSLLRWTTDDVVAGGPFSPERGLVDVPTGHGLGVELDEKALARGIERHAREGSYTFYTGGPLPRY